MDIRSEKYLQVKPMITAAAWDLSRRYQHLTYEDALGECNLQFAKSMDNHDPEKGALTTYTANVMRATKRNVQDKFCADRGIPRARRSKKELTEEHAETCKSIDLAFLTKPVNSHSVSGQDDTSELSALADIGYFDPTALLFAESRNWETEDRALLHALYIGTEQGIEATAASVARNFPTWGKSRAQQRLTSLRAKVFEVIKC